MEIFFDGGFDWEKRIGTYGYVIRDLLSSDHEIMYGGIVSDSEGQTVTHNVSEYVALRESMREVVNRISMVLPYTTIRIFGDSQLVIKHMSGIWHIGPKFVSFYLSCKSLENLISAKCVISYSWISRDNNTVADNLCEKALNEYLSHSG